MIASVLPTYNRAPLSFVKGEGSWLIEADGRRFLDLGAGIAVNALGHAHPALVAALTEQAGALWHTSNLYHIPQQEALADKLVAHTFADTVFFTNSGTESCELAVKMVRKYWHEKGQPERVELIAFEGSFHGRSSAGIAAAGSEKMTHGFGPLLPGFTHVPWGDLAAVVEAITDHTAGIMLEPVQGEGGIRPMPDDLLKQLRALCGVIAIRLVKRHDERLADIAELLQRIDLLAIQIAVRDKNHGVRAARFIEHGRVKLATHGLEPGQIGNGDLGSRLRLPAMTRDLRGAAGQRADFDRSARQERTGQRRLTRADFTIKCNGQRAAGALRVEQREFLGGSTGIDAG